MEAQWLAGLALGVGMVLGVGGSAFDAHAQGDAAARAAAAVKKVDGNFIRSNAAKTPAQT